MHLRIRGLEPEKGAPILSGNQNAGFDISKHVALVPLFREPEVGSYFGTLRALKWPKEFWSLLLQCKLVGKVQKVRASPPIEQSLDYEALKKTVLQAYELVPEAYRQKIRNNENAE